jgi:hypothetical protein
MAIEPMHDDEEIRRVIRHIIGQAEADADRPATEPPAPTDFPPDISDEGKERARTFLRSLIEDTEAETTELFKRLSDPTPDSTLPAWMQQTAD